MIQRLTIAWLESRFRLFNREFFDDKLPVPRLQVSHARTRLGMMTHKYSYVNGSVVFYAYTIRLSNYYDMDEKELEDVLLHEMIHYYIAYNRIRDTSAHGIMFRNKMEEINAKGHNIAISRNMSEHAAAMSARQPARRHVKNLFIVLAMETARGQYMLTVVNPRYVKKLEYTLNTTSDVTCHHWFVSSESYFSQFSCVRTPRGRIVTEEEYNTRTSTMTPLDITKIL